eukprot:14866-Alexandrium_andersonii.AAC.1
MAAHGALSNVGAVRFVGMALAPWRRPRFQDNRGPGVPAAAGPPTAAGAARPVGPRAPGPAHPPAKRARLAPTAGWGGGRA